MDEVTYPLIRPSDIPKAVITLPFILNDYDTDTDTYSTMCGG